LVEFERALQRADEQLGNDGKVNQPAQRPFCLTLTPLSNALQHIRFQRWPCKTRASCAETRTLPHCTPLIAMLYRHVKIGLPYWDWEAVTSDDGGAIMPTIIRRDFTGKVPDGLVKPDFGKKLFERGFDKVRPFLPRACNLQCF
jgi:hypothetical protein